MECEKCNCKKLCDKLILAGVSDISCRELKKIIQELLDEKKEIWYNNKCRKELRKNGR